MHHFLQIGSDTPQSISLKVSSVNSNCIIKYDDTNITTYINFFPTLCNFYFESLNETASPIVITLYCTTYSVEYSAYAPQRYYSGNEIESYEINITFLPAEATIQTSYLILSAKSIDYYPSVPCFDSSIKGIFTYANNVKTQLYPPSIIIYN